MASAERIFLRVLHPKDYLSCRVENKQACIIRAYGPTMFLVRVDLIDREKVRRRAKVK